jgi:hypothetical protein
MSKSTTGTWDNRLMCNVVSLAYDFTKHTGQIHLLAGDFCDMSGCVAVFEGIDPKVTAIDTFSGERVDTKYRKEGGGWIAFKSA